MADTMLDIVNENDDVIGSASRSEIHQKGLLHREVSIFFVTPQRDVVLQKRSMNKEIHPGLYAPTVSGHVDSGESYEQALVRETLEETGVSLTVQDLVFLSKKQYRSVSSGNNAIRVFYGYLYRGDVQDLVIEDIDGDGFKAWPLDSFFMMPEAMHQTIVPSLLNKEKYGDVWQALSKWVDGQ